MNIAAMMLDRVQALLWHKPVDKMRPDPNAHYTLEAARAEGWEMIRAGRDLDGVLRYHLHRVEPSFASVPVFRDDTAAWAHVVAHARTGSVMHRDALEMVDPSERTIIACFCGTWWTA